VKNLTNRPVLVALLLAAAACGGTDINKSGSDVTDLTATTYTVPVSAAVGIAPGTSTIKIGEALKLTANFGVDTVRRVAYARAALAQWISADTTVATVSTSGLVTGLRNGIVAITASNGDQTAVSVVTVGAGKDTASTVTAAASPADTMQNVAAVAATPPAPTLPPLATPPAVISAPPVATPPTAVPPVIVAPPAASPPPTSIPSPSVNSAGPGLSGLAVISDDFTGYPTTADLMAKISSLHGGTADWRTAFYSDGYGSDVSIDPSVKYNDHSTMKYTQPGGSGGSPWLAVAFPAPLAHIWYRVKVRFSPGFTTTGTLVNSANAYKMLSWGWSGHDGSGRLEISNTNQYELYENVQSGPSLVGGGNYLQAGNISTEWTDGGWYDYIIEVDHSQSVGVIRLWRSKAGQVPAYIGQTQEKMNDGSPMPQLTGISVGLNFNQVRAPNQNQAIWWGEWEVVDGTQHLNPFGVSR